VRLILSSLFVATAIAGAALPPERAANGGSLPPSNGHRVYLSDLVLNHAADGKIHIVDGDSLRYMGQLASGAGAFFAIAPDRSELYVSTTYWTRLSRGERIDEVDIYDAVTLRRRAEITLPPKRTLSIPYNSLTAISSDGRLLFIQNATPATSISVVDLKKRQLIADIPNPGCYALFAPQSAPDEIATLCGDGTVLRFTLGQDGKISTQSRTRKFFDPIADAVFITAGQTDGRFFFISFTGNVHPVDLRGPQPVVDKSWSLLTEADRQEGWRPGGYQITTVQPRTGRLYVAMHPHGTEGSHKNPAEEIWTFDIQSHRRTARTPTGAAVIAIEVSGDPNPRLFAIEGEKNGMLAFDAEGDLKLLKRVDGFGDTPLALQVR
jgi:methylamine dehydrogenase heavy chain